jgi:negative regulator of sigma-B (phosphoserine phosphatase)
MKAKTIGAEVTIEWGVVCLPKPGETQAGDGYVVKAFPDGVLVAVMDGLGHGAEAAAATTVAVATLEGYAHEPLIYLVQRCHRELKHTRGVAMSLASFNSREGVMTWIGVGNVEGLLIRSQPGPMGRRAEDRTRERLLVLGGVVGYRIPTLRSRVVPVLHGDSLILATDGIHADFGERLPSGLKPQALADHVSARHFKGTDDGLVLVARYLGGTHAPDSF